MLSDCQSIVSVFCHVGSYYLRCHHRGVEGQNCHASVHMDSKQQPVSNGLCETSCDGLTKIQTLTHVWPPTRRTTQPETPLQSFRTKGASWMRCETSSISRRNHLWHSLSLSWPGWLRMYVVISTLRTNQVLTVIVGGLTITLRLYYFDTLSCNNVDVSKYIITLSSHWYCFKMVLSWIKSLWSWVFFLSGIQLNIKWWLLNCSVNGNFIQNKDITRHATKKLKYDCWKLWNFNSIGGAWDGPPQRIGWRI